MQRLVKLLAITSLLLISGCANDPSAEDVKSPCVSYGENGDDPCVRRTPFMNIRSS